jgi:SAM-dependent methyltransferase
MPTDAAPCSPNRTVTAHYARHGDLAERILATLPVTGGDPAKPDYAALHQLDQFHLGGPAATRELAGKAEVRGLPLLDLGCGIGGPSRMLAAEYGCDVTGLDLTEGYCAAARRLSRVVGLGERTRFVCASALDLPFAEGVWSMVWTQHAAMNIPDKARLYQEVARVLAPGGRFIMHDIVAGPGREPHFPVPWASTPAGSFLLPANEIHARLAGAGLVEDWWHDKTAESLTRIREARAAAASGEPEPPGPHLVMGPEFLEMRRNLARNLEEGRVGVIEAIWRKP